MRELTKSFEGKGEKRGYFFELVEQTRLGYLYKVSQNGTVHYEVFKRKESFNPFTEIDYVRYPNSNAFGIWAWTCMSLGKAKERLYGFKEVAEEVER